MSIMKSSRMCVDPAVYANEAKRIREAVVAAGIFKEGDEIFSTFDHLRKVLTVGDYEIPASIALQGTGPIISFLLAARAQRHIAQQIADGKFGPKTNGLEVDFVVFDEGDRVAGLLAARADKDNRSAEAAAAKKFILENPEPLITMLTTPKQEPTPAAYGAVNFDEYGQARVGDWIQTFTSKKFHPLDIKPEDIAVEDIAHALSLVNRFTGHTRVAYSVAEHSVRVMWCVHGLLNREYYISGSPYMDLGSEDPDLILFEALLHDASEAYLADIARPVKMLDVMKPYRELEKLVEKAIASKYDLPTPMSPIVKRADEILLGTEARDLMSPMVEGWILRERQLPETIKPWSADLAEYRFLQEYRLLVDRLGLKF